MESQTAPISSSVVGNVGMETNEDKSSGKAPAFILGGIIYSVSENFDIDAGVKAGLNEPETDVEYLAGLAIRFLKGGSGWQMCL